jgi:hypothetical protein
LAGIQAGSIGRSIWGNLRVSASFGKRAMIPAAELERFVNRLGEYEVRNIGRRAHKAYREKQLAEAAE